MADHDDTDMAEEGHQLARKVDNRDILDTMDRVSDQMAELSRQLHTSISAAIGAAVQNEIIKVFATHTGQLDHASFELQIQERDSKILELETCVKNLEAENVERCAKIVELDERVAKYYKMCLSKRKDDTGLSDDHITKSFKKLSYEITQFAKRYCGPCEKTPWQWYNDLPVEGKDLWPRTYIADQLYEHCFKGHLFGLRWEEDKILAELEVKFQKKADSNDGRIKHDGVLDWRTQTVKMIEAAAITESVEQIDEVVKIIYRELEAVFSFDCEALQLVKPELQTLCERAFKLAMKFRGSKIKYAWFQIVSTPKPDITSDGVTMYFVNRIGGAGNSPQTIFGAVRKYDGEWITLREAEESSDAFW